MEMEKKKFVDYFWPTLPMPLFPGSEDYVFNFDGKNSVAVFRTENFTDIMREQAWSAGCKYFFVGVKRGVIFAKVLSKNNFGLFCDRKSVDFINEMIDKMLNNKKNK